MGPQTGPGLMREMSTELQTRLQSGTRSQSQAPPVNKKPAAPVIPKHAAQNTGIKFNEQAEVVEVEKVKNETER